MSRAEKNIAIITYIDNTAKMREEFDWLYKSWIYSGCWKTSDLIIVHHPALIGQFPLEAGIRPIPLLPHSHTDPLFREYHFINSIACLSGPHIDNLLLRYRWVLRTDADVFLTHHMAHFEPIYPVHGRGNYYLSPEFREKMLDFCQRHQTPHHQRFGCGSSILLHAEQMVVFLQRQMHWARKLAEDFGTDRANWGTWPGWYRSVLSMYAAEIAVNERWGVYLQHGRERILDMESCSEGFIDALTLHIHATPGEAMFSKFAYRAGKYAHLNVDELDRRRIGEYCLWLVMTDVETIKALANYSGR